MSFIGNVKLKENLDKLPNNSDGDIAFSESENCFYIYDEDKWTKAEVKKQTPISISLYDINKDLIEREGRS